MGIRGACEDCKDADEVAGCAYDVGAGSGNQYRCSCGRGVTFAFLTVDIVPAVAFIGNYIYFYLLQVLK